MRCCHAAAAAALLSLAMAGVAPAAWREFKATVTLDGVHYTLPTYFKDQALNARQPLCHTFEYATMVVVARELYINGEVVYRARAGDHVVVAYPMSVQVNGQPAPPPPAKRLEPFPCTGADFQ